MPAREYYVFIAVNRHWQGICYSANLLIGRYTANDD